MWRQECNESESRGPKEYREHGSNCDINKGCFMLGGRKLIDTGELSSRPLLDALFSSYHFVPRNQTYQLRRTFIS